MSLFGRIASVPGDFMRNIVQLRCKHNISCQEIVT